MKTGKELEQAILELIRTLYCKEYTGLIKVIEMFNTAPFEPPTHTGYLLKLGLNKDERPLTIAKEGTDEEFLKFIEGELKSRRLNLTKYFTAIQLYYTPNECEKGC